MADAAFEITGAAELRAVAGDLVKVPPKMRAELRVRMTAAAQPMKRSVQANALAIPTHGETSTGLRQSIARATKTRTAITPETVNVKVYVDPGAMPPGQEKLPALMESSGWTHEVYGHPNTVFQRGHAYFQPAVDPLLPAMFAAVDSAIAEATRTI